MPRHSNIAFFIPHLGCPHRCSFCQQNTISGAQTLPDAALVTQTCAAARAQIADPTQTEIAFFGGSFTAIPRGYMLELLTAAQPFVGENGFSGIRISTRPDCIDAAVLTLLRQYGVTSIELGAQSMCDRVLTANGRGHTAHDVERAAALIHAFGFSLGLQMMVGLYKSTPADEIATAERLVALRPAAARIYPVVILKDTPLAALYAAGTYVPYAFEEAVEITADCMQRFRRENMTLLKVGLHASELVAEACVGGFYHPAFRELCESRIYRREIARALDGAEIPPRATFSVPAGRLSQALGQKRSNLAYFAQRGITLTIIADAAQQQSLVRIE